MLWFNLCSLMNGCNWRGFISCNFIRTIFFHSLGIISLEFLINFVISLVYISVESIWSIVSYSVPNFYGVYVITYLFLFRYIYIRFFLFSSLPDDGLWPKHVVSHLITLLVIQYYYYFNLICIRVLNLYSIRYNTKFNISD